MKRKILAGSTSVIERVFIRDTSQTLKVAGLTGLTSGSAGLTLYWCRAGDASSTSVTLAAGTLGTWSSGGFVALDGTNMPGSYELGIPNAAVASGAKAVAFHLRGAANMEDITWQYELDAVNYQDGTRFGLTALPTASAGASGGLATIDASLQTLAKINAYAVGQDPATLLLVTPANKLATDASGNVTIVSGNNRVTKNTALNNFQFPMFDSTTPTNLKTGLTVTATRSIDGGAYGACANSVVEVGSGTYKINLAASDLNGNVISLLFTATGAVALPVTIVTQI